MDDTTPVVKLGDPMDPALEAASLALSGRTAAVSSGFASIELRSEAKHRPLLAPLAYAASVIFAIIVIGVLWSI